MSREQTNDRLVSRQGEEEWIHITDPQERKRIQNRVSQRNYRRRLKHRIEDLERETARSHSILGLNLEEIIRPREVQQGCHVFPIQTTPRQTAQRSDYERVMNENSISTSSPPLEQPFQLNADVLESLVELGSPWVSSHGANNRPQESFVDSDLQGVESYTPATSTSSGSSVPSMSSFLFSQLPTPAVRSKTANSRSNFAEEPLIRQQSATVRQDSGRLGQTQANSGSKTIETRLRNDNCCITTDNTDSSITWQRRPILQQHHHLGASLLRTYTQEQEPVSPLPEKPLEERFTHILLSTLEAGFKDIDSMILQYYTTAFRYDSVIHWAQKRSRMECLKPLLVELSAASTSWQAEEAGQYQDAILKMASRLCAPDFDVDINTPNTDDSTTHALGDGP